MRKPTLQEWRKHRPNKLAAGLSFTRANQKRNKPLTSRGSAAATLAVKGTTDRIGTLFRFKVKRLPATDKLPCPCCGLTDGRGKLVLSDSGRARLRTLKRRKEQTKCKLT